MIKTIPKADIEELAAWLYFHNGGMNFRSWAKAGNQCQQRWRGFAKKLLEKPPEVLLRNVKEAM